MCSLKQVPVAPGWFLARCPVSRAHGFVNRRLAWSGKRAAL